MNVERLHAIALSVRADLDQTGSVAATASLRDALRNSIASPQEPSYQEAVSTGLQTLLDALSTAPSNDFPPLWVEALEELGISELVGAELARRLRSIFERNQITPSVAADEVDAIADELSGLDAALTQLLAGLAHFELGSEDLDPGQAELGVLIPRPAVRDELELLGSEFVELQRLLGPFLEIATGSRPPLTVRTISSSDFGVFLDIAPQAAAFVAVAVERLVALYKQLLEIRKLRQELADHGVPPERLDGIDDHANEHMATGIEAVVDELLAAREEASPGRDNELRIELKLSLNAIANRIDRGYNIDVRAEPEEHAPSDGEEEDAPGEGPDAVALRRIVEISPKLRFINRSGEPILSLPEPADDGDADESEEAS